MKQRSQSEDVRLELPWRDFGGGAHSLPHGVGKMWLTVLFFFRMLVLGVAAEDVWNDEQADFICNTEQPGCGNVCYDRTFPISSIRYWVLQVIFVSSPALVYMGHTLYRLRALEKARQEESSAAEGAGDGGHGIGRNQEEDRTGSEAAGPGQAEQSSTQGILVAHVRGPCSHSVVKVAFMTGQYILYGFQLYPLFKCPCPNAVDCCVSRPTEKSVFVVFMQCIAAISLFLNILEIMHLGYKKIKQSILDLCCAIVHQCGLEDDHYLFTN